MDPWLEDPARWPDVHTRLLVAVSDVLVPVLPERYAVRVEERVYVDDEPEGAFRADVAVVTAPGAAPSGEDAGQAGALAVPVVVPTVVDTTERERFLEVVLVGTDEVVTVVELLSPSNKRGPGAEGRRQYLRKRGEVLRSAAHLVELDLLRAGHRVPMRRPLPPAAYYVIVSHAARRPRSDVYPVGLRDRLPAFAFPLQGDETVPIDLQAALDLAWDRARWGPQLDRRRPPVPPLDPEAAAWARGLLEPSPPP